MDVCHRSRHQANHDIPGSPSVNGSVLLLHLTMNEAYRVLQNTFVQRYSRKASFRGADHPSEHGPRRGVPGAIYSPRLGAAVGVQNMVGLGVRGRFDCACCTNHPLLHNRHDHTLLFVEQVNLQYAHFA